MKALIVDPAVHSRGGHHHTAVKRLQTELAQRGIKAPCLGSAHATPDIVRDLVCTPVFERSVYGRDYAERLDLSTARMSRELSRAVQQDGAWPDMLILPCCDQVLAASVAQLLRRNPLKPAPQILMWLLYGPHHLLAPEDPAAETFRGESRQAFTALLEAAGERQRITAYCETDAMAAFYRKLLSVDMNVGPGAGISIPAAVSAAPTHGRRPNVTMLGFANHSKGYRLLPEAIEKLLRQDNGSTFTIHGIVAGSDAEDEAWVFDRLAGLGPRVVTRRDVLSDEEYLGLLSHADLLLLPYDPDVYRSRGSGIVTEARRLGIPIVAPAQCAFARPAFDGGWGVAFSNYHADGLASAIGEALGRLAVLKAHASGAAGAAKDELGSILQSTVEAARARRRHGMTGTIRRLLGRALEAK